MTLMAAGVASWVLTYVVRAIALRRNILDIPNLRSSHERPTPRGGGLAVVVVVLVGSLAAASDRLVLTSDPLTILIGTAAVAAVGWIDDNRGLSARIRLIAQTIVSGWTTWRLGGLPALALGEEVLYVGVAGYALATFGVVWSINLFNFMDGIDGFAGSQAALVFGTFSLILLRNGDFDLALVSGVASAASVGFLWWNWSPAKIFMGDVGSGALGYLAASLALAGEKRGTASLIVCCLIAAVLVADASVTLLRRIARGERVTQAHRSHAYQRLTRAWRSHRAVSLAGAAVTLGLCSAGYTVTLHPTLLPLVATSTVVSLGAMLYIIERTAPM